MLLRRPAYSANSVPKSPLGFYALAVNLEITMRRP